MESTSILDNRILIAAAIGWLLAQGIKVPLNFILYRDWNWSLLFSTGGMPSSHSALVAGAAHAAGLYMGFGSAYFALAAVIAIVVIYDATGIRRQAGKHAAVINAMIQDLATGHPLKEEQLREVLGHTPMEAVMGTLLGVVISQLVWLLWR
ncbi:MAG: divergent PAP2 family protein [Anaerolineales bacterium]|jgi:hypothetical protein|nr:divergent PAP2 family protein [Anaerolineales bacterium]